MLGGRDKAGKPDVDWTALSLSKKHQRKTIGFGPYSKKEKSYKHEIYIRELNLVAGGLGCALWDGSVVLSRWIYNNPDIFENKTVLELGAGCGLPGIMAARTAKFVTLTEYVDQLVDNIAYNISLNSIDETESHNQSQNQNIYDKLFEKDIRNNTKCLFLDWFQVSNHTSHKIITDQNRKKCTLEENGRNFIEQEWFHCESCFGNDESEGICVNCSLECHKGHLITFSEKSKFRCDCQDKAECLLTPKKSNPQIDKVDIIIGAELTYNLISIDALINTIEYYLKEDGVFYEVLSDDRDGVAVFVNKIKEKGFSVDKVSVNPDLMGNYGTRHWTFQNTETYSFYTFRKPSSAFPVMS